MLRKLVSLAIFVLLGLALYRVGPVYLRYQEFKDAVGDTALFSADKSEDAIRDRVVEQAQHYGVPLDPDDITLHKVGDHTSITVTYVELLRLLPGYSRPWQFNIETE